MTDKTPHTERVPQWPKFSAVLYDDGTGELEINGASEPIAAADITVARTIVLERVAAYARDELHRPVRLHTTDPDGRWELAVHPNGDVDELAGEPTSAPPAAATVRVSRRRTVAERTSTPGAPRRGVRQPRRRLIEAGVALGLVVAIAVVLVLSSRSDPSPRRATVSVATPTTTVAPGAIKAIIDARRATAAAHAARVAKARHARFVRHQAAAHRRAVARRVARKRAAAKRRAQARAAARARARARRQAAARPPAPAATPRPTPRPPAPPPPPAQSPVCQEFPPC
jgi:hypothetical protein